MHSTKEEKKDDKRTDVLNGIADLPYHERITRFLRGSTMHWVKGGVTVVDFRPLYTVTLHDLQRQLVAEIHRAKHENVTDVQLKSIREILHQYSETIFDFLRLDPLR